MEIRPPADIFSLYEQNIGMLTPMIAEALQEAEKLYPAEWIESAFKEAVALNKRSWKYIARILERWAIEGKDDGKSRRDSKKEDDRDKYIRGKYGHMVKR
jgi:DnaD/phage-associated family protein